MTEMAQHGRISPSNLDDSSEKQQQSYHSESEDIASLQDKWPSNNQAAPEALETPTSKPRIENVSENVNNGKGGLESADTSKLSDEAENQENCGQATQRHESGGSSGKRRRRECNPMPEEGEAGNEGECGGKKKRSRCAAEEQKISMLGEIKLPDFMKELTDADPEVQELRFKLFNINKRLQTIVASGDGERSPSPEPQLNNLGIGMNIREDRAQEKLLKERQMIIARLIEKNPAFGPPADSKPVKQHKKLYIPVKEYPGYNFAGLIIGPRGNTQKRMERKTGAKIFLRGRGSRKDSRLLRRDLKLDPSDNEDLHVFIEADNENSLEEACRMVEKLLVPVEEDRNSHKWAQLRELAEINGTVKLDICCRFCGNEGHKQVTCPVRKITFKNDLMCCVCGDEDSTINCRKKVSLQSAKVDTTNNHDLCVELGIGKSAASVEKSGSGVPRQSIQPLGPTDNYMSRLAQAGGENGNAGIGSEIVRVSMESGGSELPIQSSQPLGLSDNYISRLPRQSTQPLGFTTTGSSLAGGLEHSENVNAGIGPEIRKSVSGLPGQSTQSTGFTDNYMSWLTGGFQHQESGKDGIGPEIRKVYVEKSVYRVPRQSTQPLGLKDNYMSWLAGGLEHRQTESAGIGTDTRKGGGFGTSSIQGSCPYRYSPYSSQVDVESSFESPSFSHMGLGSHFEHNHGKEFDHANVYVGYLPPTMEEEQLIKLFSSFGRIVEARIIRDHVNGSSKGYGFVKFYNIHCAAQATAHMNGYKLEGKTLAVRVVGWPPSGSRVGPAEGLYTFDKRQPPRLPVHSCDYAQPSWSSPTRIVSSSPYNPYSDNDGSGMSSHSVSPLQGGTFNSLPATSFWTYGLYQMPLPFVESSSGMQGPPRSQQVLGNVHDSSMSKPNVHSANAMSHVSPNQARISTYWRYAPLSILSGSAWSQSPSRGSLMGDLGTPWSSSLFPFGYEKKAVGLNKKYFDLK